ncbi:small ribosomal subunit protein mS26 isoform X2 [Struthio camelus]|uniref:small ribosomal subunit protein mS26 isoform X2 n=1 Tax=Struthio camelus TaxID=8801 RepID=UPI003604256C
MLPALWRCRPRAALGVAPASGPGPGAGLGAGVYPGAAAWFIPARGRKTRHDPPAKSKASRLKVPPPVDPAELLVVTERYRQHRLLLSALRSVFRAEVSQKKRERLLSGEDTEERSEEHRLLMAWNDAENARQRARSFEAEVLISTSWSQQQAGRASRIPVRLGALNAAENVSLVVRGEIDVVRNWN